MSISRSKIGRFGYWSVRVCSQVSRDVKIRFGHAVQVRPAQIALPATKRALAGVTDQCAAEVRACPLATSAPDGTKWLAAQSQAAFDAGEQDFRAGHLGKAREEFDQALDQLLASGFDLESRSAPQRVVSSHRRHRKRGRTRSLPRRRRLPRTKSHAGAHR